MLAAPRRCLQIRGGLLDAVREACNSFEVQPRKSMCFMAVAIAAACGNESGADQVAAEPICDGSDGPRLVYTASPGFGNAGDRFTAVNGDRYLVVTGRCEYVVGDDTLRGMRRGTIGAAAAEQLSSRLHFGRYWTADDYLGTPCPDAPTTVLVDSSGTLVSVGCADGAAPRVWREAFREIGLIYTELAAEASYDWAATRVLPVRPEQPIALERVLAWTVALDLEPAAVDWIDLVRGVGTFDGILVSDPAVLDELAELRLSGLLLDPFTSELAVRDSLGRTYQLLLRDELPAAASSAVRSASEVAVQRTASQ